MKDRPSKEENKLFVDLTSGLAGNLILMPIELDGKETTCIFAYEEIPNDTNLALVPIAILVTDDIARMIKTPEGIDELTINDLDNDSEEDDEPDFLSNLPQN
jgi:hypothetical protein